MRLRFQSLSCELSRFASAAALADAHRSLKARGTLASRNHRNPQLARTAYAASIKAAHLRIEPLTLPAASSYLTGALAPRHRPSKAMLQVSLQRVILAAQPDSSISVAGVPPRPGVTSPPRAPFALHWCDPMLLTPLQQRRPTNSLLTARHISQQLQ